MHKHSQGPKHSQVLTILHFIAWGYKVIHFVTNIPKAQNVPKFLSPSCDLIFSTVGCSNLASVSLINLPICTNCGNAAGALEIELSSTSGVAEGGSNAKGTTRALARYLCKEWDTDTIVSIVNAQWTCMYITICQLLQGPPGWIHWQCTLRQIALPLSTHLCSTKGVHQKGF